MSVFDHGLLYGDGIFEGIRAYNGRVFKLDRHIERLFESAKAIRLDIRSLRATSPTSCSKHAARTPSWTVTFAWSSHGASVDLGIDPRSCPRADVFVIARPVGALYRHAPDKGISLATSPFRRIASDALSPEIKSLNYLNNVLAKMDASDRGADEALFLGHDGHVAEATADNIFIVDSRGVATPPTTTRR